LKLSHSPARPLYRFFGPGLVALFAVTPALHAESGADLSARVAVDGRLDEYTADEWVLDPDRAPFERTGDSRWGTDNDIRRVAVTWDHARLYVAVECATFDAGVLLLLDHATGGIDDMRALTNLRRAVVFSGFAPDLLVLAEPESQRPVAWRFSSGGAPETLGDGVVEAFFASTQGALEAAIPWPLVRSASGVVDFVAAITGGEGTGCGDAAPDPSAVLGVPRTGLAVLDRVLRVVVDSDLDGTPDAGVAPRDVAAVVPDDRGAVVDEVTLRVRPALRSFAPDLGEIVEFSLEREGAVGVERVYVTARVYSLSGEVVRVLYEDDPRDFTDATPGAAMLDAWDGTDRGGAVVAGGIYVINVGWGVARGSRTGGASASVAVIR
jgi:hypothetical protein